MNNIKNFSIKIIENMIKFSGSWIGTFIIVAVVIFFIAQAFIIPSGSMKNTLLIGDGLFGQKYSYGIVIPRIPFLEIPILPDLDNDGHLFSSDTKPKRGEIVIFRYPHQEKLHYVKRCVATEGDMLMMKNKILYLRPSEGDEYIKKNWAKEKQLTINNKLWVQHPYKDKYKGINYDNKTFPEKLVQFSPIKIKKNEYYMIGDNRDHSNDSRFWGAVPYKYIVGKPWFIYFSWENRNYYDMINSRDSKDIELLQDKCVGINVNDQRCRDSWEKYQYSIRWDRMFTNLINL